MGGIGGPELLLVFFVILLVFGPKKIPEVARGLGKGVREFRRLSTEFQREINLSDALDEKPDPSPHIAPPRESGPKESGSTEAGTAARGSAAEAGAQDAGAQDAGPSRPLPPGAELPGSGTGDAASTESGTGPETGTGRIPREGGSGPSGPA